MRGRANGVYFFRVITDDGVLQSNKFVYLAGRGADFIGGGSAPTNPKAWKGLPKAPKQANGDYWRVIIQHPDYEMREQLLYIPEPGSFELDLDAIAKSWDLDSFDQMAGRNTVKGTERWMKSPKLYIINGPLAGYTNFQTPTQAEIDSVIATWKAFKEYTRGFIDIPDSNIYIGHDVNDSVFQDAIVQIFNGNARPDTSNGERWNVVLWTDNVGTGDHGETVVNGEIKGAVQRYRQGCTQATRDIEAVQSIGFPIDPSDPYIRYNYDENKYTIYLEQCIWFDYSRLPMTMIKDIATWAQEVKN